MGMNQQKDPINPSYYKGDFVMRVIDDWDLGFDLGSAFKYISRYKGKDNLQDLKKALWYLKWYNNKFLTGQIIPRARGHHIPFSEVWEALMFDVDSDLEGIIKTFSFEQTYPGRRALLLESQEKLIAFIKTQDPTFEG